MKGNDVEQRVQCVATGMASSQRFSYFQGEGDYVHCACLSVSDWSEEKCIVNLN